MKKVGLIITLVVVFTSLNWAQTETKNGYKFINHTRVEGKKAAPGDKVYVHVNTWVGDSLMLDTRSLGSARELPLPTEENLPKGKPVPPLFDAVCLMAVGDSASVFQPIDSNIRKVLPPQLLRAEFVQYNISLLQIVRAEETEKAAKANLLKLADVITQTNALIATMNEGKNEQLKTTASGLRYIVHDPGIGEPYGANKPVKAHYYGCLMNGKAFDNSFERNAAIEFTTGIGQMIPGFDEGAQLLGKGGKATLFLPYTLAYGEEGIPGGPIPQKADLVFYIELD